MKTDNTTCTCYKNTADNKKITIYFEDHPYEVPAGITLAAALLGHGDNPFCQEATDHEPAAPHCLMGVCFECLVEIDGVKNRQACLEPVRPGMQVKRQLVLVPESS